jgi:hypothetical protein
VAVYLLGAPGSGKSALRPLLTEALRDRVVLDWDDFMAPASALAGVDVRRSPSAWSAYGELIRAAVEGAGAGRCIVLGVCTPQELVDWPIDGWLLLDCTDDERARRLADRPADLAAALEDARAYRSLGLPTVDTTGRRLPEVAQLVATWIEARP